MDSEQNKLAGRDHCHWRVLSAYCLYYLVTFVCCSVFFLTRRHEGIHDVSRPARSVQISPLHPEGLCQCTCQQNPLLRSKCFVVSVNLLRSSSFSVINTLHLIIELKYVRPCRANFCTAMLLQVFMQKTSSLSTRSSWMRTLKAPTSLPQQTNRKSRGLKMWSIRTSSIRYIRCQATEIKVN